MRILGTLSGGFEFAGPILRLKKTEIGHALVFYSCTIYVLVVCRSIFDEDRIPVLEEESGLKQDVHGVASLLKMYFRELPNPLCTYQLYDEFVAAVQSTNDERLDNMRRVVQKLPPPHYRLVFAYLGEFFGYA